ncbi:MAG: pseudouridylate synthase [Fluviicola sp.]|nr:pseudouridylate synthase [Fluviicola sp.]
MLEILYQDEFVVAINKPHGLLVHRTKIANDADEFAVQLLRDQIEMKVFPAHRLDRKTSGVLLFALSAEINSILQKQFMNKEVRKKYLAIVRGYTEDELTIDYSLTNEDGKTQDAITRFTTLQRTECNFPSGKFPTSRYSLLEITPETGRFHQIRKHLAHLRHPIIGDRPHGCNKQNKLFLERFQMSTMLLHAKELHFVHPVSNEQVFVEANCSEEFRRMKNELF